MLIADFRIEQFEHARAVEDEYESNDDDEHYDEDDNGEDLLQGLEIRQEGRVAVTCFQL